MNIKSKEQLGLVSGRLACQAFAGHEATNFAIDVNAR